MGAFCEPKPKFGPLSNLVAAPLVLSGLIIMFTSPTCYMFDKDEADPWVIGIFLMSIATLT